MEEKILVTGAAGFIGFHLVKRLLASKAKVVGVDNLNSYYDVGLKQSRLNILNESDRFQFHELSISSNEFYDLCLKERFSKIINLAAQAGVRYSSENPDVYVDSNINGFYNVLKVARETEVEHLIFASTSSVYGLNGKYPYSASDATSHQLSFYAATKKTNEILAHSYSHLYNIPMTGLRFFTVYGPWGRPDMALFLFTDAILNSRPIRVFNQGELWRDFTYVDDIVESIMRLIPKAPEPNPEFDTTSPDQSSSLARFKLYNIGNSVPIKLTDMISTLEEVLGVSAIKQYEPLHPGDVFKTFSDSSPLQQDIGFTPKTSLYDGFRKFVEWYKEYYQS